MTDDELKAETARGVVRAADVMCMYAGIFTRVHGPHPAGHVMDGHTHNFDHQTLLVSGAVRVKWERRAKGDSGEVVASGEKVFKAPAAIIVRADTCHELTAIEDSTVWCCLFRVPEGEDIVGEGSNPYV